ncbi:MAG: asparagine synthase (glutamine-hydrolyzing) [Bacteroidota bacterium]
MCGIAGYVDFNKNTSKGTIEKMVQVLNHRGPDDNGAEIYNTNTADIGLGQARLSIIDLSYAGHQPMHYKNLSIVFNGEIYNYKEIKIILIELGHVFISNSDTEVILHAYEQWGKEFVHRLIGMFVIVVYNKDKQKILILRDRAGVKPVHCYWQDGLFLFASELKSFHVHSGFIKEIDKQAVELFFAHGYIPSPYSIFKNCFKLEPGKILELDLTEKKITIETYWNIDDYYVKPKLNISYHDAKVQVRDLLISACNYRMVADVPVGIFLSGGYDSSTMTAILQRDRTAKLKTFTIGFQNGLNETPYAKEVANIIGTDHTEYICSPSDAQSIIPDLPFFYDEPFADISAIPTILVSQLARKQVTVALSADAGDEIFAGYTVYREFEKYLKLMNHIPGGLKSITSQLLDMASILVPSNKYQANQKLFAVSKSLNRNRYNQTTSLLRIAKSLPNHFMDNLLNFDSASPPTTYNSSFVGFHNEIEIAMAIDYKMYLQDCILTKVDRATMSVSLEGREPFLDHRLVELAAQLPLEYKYNHTTDKRILKDIAHEFIPKKLLDRPKDGFDPPIYKWLNNDLSYLIDKHLSENAIKKSGLFNYNFVNQQVELFRANKFHYKPLIWRLLMFQMWFEMWMI